MPRNKVEKTPSGARVDKRRSTAKKPPGQRLEGNPRRGSNRTAPAVRGAASVPVARTRAVTSTSKASELVPRRELSKESPRVAKKHGIKSSRKKIAHGRPSKPHGQHAVNPAKTSRKR